MQYLILSIIGIVMGTFGGLIGVGGSIIMIPAMTMVFGENQHLYQAAAMICNFFVAASAAMVHRSKGLLVPRVLKWFIPSATAGIITGVAISNLHVFAGSNSFVLTKIFGLFLIYVIFQTASGFWRKPGGRDDMDMSQVVYSPARSIFAGLLTGIGGGMLGLGGGLIATPLQQILLKMPFKRAVMNSAATIASVAIIGAVYKNATLPLHGIAVMDSLKISLVVIPCAVIGGTVGGRLMHKLPQDLVRAVFLVLVVFSCIKLLMTTEAH